MNTLNSEMINYLTYEEYPISADPLPQQERFLFTLAQADNHLIQNPSPSEPSIEVPEEDPLIDKGAQNLVYIGVGLLAIAVVIVIGLFSRKVEHALVFAAILSIGLIGLLLLL